MTGVEETAVLAYLSDGRRLRDESIRELAGAVDQVIALIICVFVCLTLISVYIRVQQTLSRL